MNYFEKSELSLNEGPRRKRERESRLFLSVKFKGLVLEQLTGARRERVCVGVSLHRDELRDWCTNLTKQLRITRVISAVQDPLTRQRKKRKRRGSSHKGGH